MAEKEITAGIAHELPVDLRRALLTDDSALERWKVLLRLHVTNGFAGLLLRKNQKQDKIILKELFLS